MCVCTIYTSDGSVVSFQKSAVTVVTLPADFLKITVAVVIKLTTAVAVVILTTALRLRMQLSKNIRLYRSCGYSIHHYNESTTILSLN